MFNFKIFNILKKKRVEVESPKNDSQYIKGILAILYEIKAKKTSVQFKKDLELANSIPNLSGYFQLCNYGQDIELKEI